MLPATHLQILGSFQAVWEQLEDIDQHTLLLDSAQVLAHPYSQLQRCIALGNSCSCQLQLSSACPTALPQVVGPAELPLQLIVRRAIYTVWILYSHWVVHPQCITSTIQQIDWASLPCKLALVNL
jgi:hypothetical protein